MILDPCVKDMLLLAERKKLVQSLLHSVATEYLEAILLRRSRKLITTYIHALLNQEITTYMGEKVVPSETCVLNW